MTLCNGLTDPSRIAHVPGTLIKDPTDLGIAPPYGGTVLGVTRDREFIPGVETHHVVAEEWGQTVETIFTGDAAVFAAVLREYNRDAMTTVFAQNSSVGASGEALIEGGVPLAGVKLSANGHVLLFAPEDPKDPAVLLYKAVAYADAQARFAFQLDEDIGLAAVWVGHPRDDGRVYAMGLLSDLVL